MELTNEEIVTKLLSSREIISTNNRNIFVSNPNFNLGNFLNDIKNTPNNYGGKYVFIK